MDDQQITPEEKLLNFIEHPQALKPKAMIMPRARGFDIQTIVLQLRRAWEKRAARGFNLALANKILWGLCGLCTLGAVIGFLGNQAKVSARLAGLEKGQSLEAGQLQGRLLALLPTNLDEGLGRAEARNIFSFIPPKSQAPVESAASVLVDQRLVGIIWSASPQAIIENTKEGKTSLLGVGDTEGKMKIKKIFRDRILIEVNGQEMELR